MFLFLVLRVEPSSFTGLARAVPQDSPLSPLASKLLMMTGTSYWEVSALLLRMRLAVRWDLLSWEERAGQARVDKRVAGSSDLTGKA